MRKSLLNSIAIGAGLAAGTGYASCSVEYETVVRGRFVRCESASFYWDASGADRAIQETWDRALAQHDRSVHERLRERWREQDLLPGLHRPQFNLVAVVRVDWQAFTTAPWRPEVSDVVELRDEPREFYQTVRYLWSGPAEACEGAAEWSSVDLWVTYPCCDTLSLPGEDGCLVRMNYAEPAPVPMRDALSKALPSTQ